MHEPAFVGIERSKLLIEAGLLHLLGEKLRHLPQLGVLPLAVLEGVHKNPLVVGQRASVRHVHDVLQRFERLAAMTHQNFRLVTREIDPRAGCRLFDKLASGIPFRPGRIRQLECIDNQRRAAPHNRRAHDAALAQRRGVDFEIGLDHIDRA